jgi:NitT/TauT family transport system substrate-binding protein
MFTRVRRVSCCALAAAAVALLSSCSGSTAGSGDVGGAPINITVGALPVVDDVGVYIAQSEGLFKQYGLNVKIDPLASSAVAIPDMQNGTIDMVGGGNYVSFIQQAAKTPSAPPFKILAEAATCSSGSFTILTLPGSGITTPASLEGKTIAVNLTNNIQTLMINSVLTADDVDAAKVNYKAIAFPLMEKALTSHQVDAISVVEPFATQAEQTTGAVPIVDQCSGPDAALPLSGYLATSAWAQKNPEAVSRFQKAISAAQEVADTDRAEVQQTLPKYIKGLTAVQAATITLETFPTSVDASQLNRVSNLMREAGLLSGSLQASSLIQN